MQCVGGHTCSVWEYPLSALLAIWVGVVSGIPNVRTKWNLAVSYVAVPAVQPWSRPDFSQWPCKRECIAPVSPRHYQN